MKPLLTSHHTKDMDFGLATFLTDIFGRFDRRASVIARRVGTVCTVLAPLPPRFWGEGL